MEFFYKLALIITITLSLTTSYITTATKKASKQEILLRDLNTNIRELRSKLRMGIFASRDPKGITKRSAAKLRQKLNNPYLIKLKKKNKEVQKTVWEAEAELRAYVHESSLKKEEIDELAQRHKKVMWFSLIELFNQLESLAKKNDFKNPKFSFLSQEIEKLKNLIRERGVDLTKGEEASLHYCSFMIKHWQKESLRKPKPAEVIETNSEGVRYIKARPFGKTTTIRAMIPQKPEELTPGYTP